MIKSTNPLNAIAAETKFKQEMMSSAAGKLLSADSFNATYQRSVGPDSSLKFSTHAQGRLTARNIQLTADDLSHMEQAVDKAASKGARQSLLVVMKDQAFIVHVPSRTVITAIDQDNMKAKVFINIDSTVMI